MRDLHIFETSRDMCLAAGGSSQLIWAQRYELAVAKSNDDWRERLRGTELRYVFLHTRLNPDEEAFVRSRIRHPEGDILQRHVCPTSAPERDR